MKKIVLFISLISAISVLTAQSPSSFKYQAIARTASGEIMANEDVEFIVSILQEIDGDPIFSETHNVTTNQYGLVTFNIGRGIDHTSSFSGIDWSTGKYFIQVQLNGNIMGTSQLLSVPFAKYADKAGNAFSGNYNDLSNKPDLTAYVTNTTNNQNLDTLNRKISLLENIFMDMGKLLYDTESTGRFKDVTNNEVYKFVIIGNQTWMAENLRATKYNDGTPIPIVSDNTEWLNLTTGAYCWYDNDSSYQKPYGALYNGFTVETGMLCPTGWHVPTNEDWKTLELTIGMKESDIDVLGWRGENIGSKLKALTGWRYSSFTQNTDTYSFTAVAGGTRSTYQGEYYNITEDCWFWSSSEYSSETLWQRSFTYNNSMIQLNAGGKNRGISVRCIKNTD